MNSSQSRPAHLGPRANSPVNSALSQGWRARSRRTVVTPSSVPGSSTAAMTRANCSLPAARSAAKPSVAIVTAKPSSRRIRSIAWPRPRSSSTMRTFCPTGYIASSPASCRLSGRITDKVINRKAMRQPFRKEFGEIMQFNQSLIIDIGLGEYLVAETSALLVSRRARNATLPGENEAANRIERGISRAHRPRAVEGWRIEEGQHRPAELQSERDLRQRAMAAADRDERQRGAGDEGVTRFPDTGRDRDRDKPIGGLPLALGQQSDRDPARQRCALAGCFHNPSLSAAQQHEAEP